MATAVIDGHYLLHRSLYSPGADLVTTNGLPSGPTYVFLKVLWNFKDIGKPVVVFDSPGARSAFRREIYPEYKVRAPAKTEEERLQKEENQILLVYTLRTLMNLLPKMGIPVVVVPGAEGDDVIYRLASHFSKSGEDVWAVSDDNDYLQFVNLPNTRVYQPMKDKRWDKAVFLEEHGFDSSFFIMYKALIGDGSDNIKGIHGIGEVTAGKIMKSLPSPDLMSLWDWANSGEKAMHKKVKEGFKDVLKRNMRLMDLQQMTLPDEQVMACYQEALNKISIDVQYVLEQFRKYEFHSFSYWTTWLMQQRMLSGKV